MWRSDCLILRRPESSWSRWNFRRATLLKVAKAFFSQLLVKFWTLSKHNENSGEKQTKKNTVRFTKILTFTNSTVFFSSKMNDFNPIFFFRNFFLLSGMIRSRLFWTNFSVEWEVLKLWHQHCANSRLDKIFVLIPKGNWVFF